jgi:hypothetical protein
MNFVKKTLLFNIYASMGIRSCFGSIYYLHMLVTEQNVRSNQFIVGHLDFIS